MSALEQSTLWELTPNHWRSFWPFESGATMTDDTTSEDKEDLVHSEPLNPALGETVNWLPPTVTQMNDELSSAFDVFARSDSPNWCHTVSREDLVDAIKAWGRWQQEELDALGDIEVVIDGSQEDNPDMINEIKAHERWTLSLLDGIGSTSYGNEWDETRLNQGNGGKGAKWSPTSRLLDLAEMAPDMAKFDWNIKHNQQKTACGALVNKEFRFSKVEVGVYSVGITSDGEKVYVPNKYIFGGHPRVPVKSTLFYLVNYDRSALLKSVFSGYMTLEDPKKKMLYRFYRVSAMPKPDSID